MNRHFPPRTDIPTCPDGSPAVARRRRYDEKTGKHDRAIVKGGKGAAKRTVGLLGGISRSIESHAEMILQACEAEPQVYLRELRDSLRDKGVTTSTSGLHRFFARHGISRKKGIRTPPSRAVPT